MTRHDVNEASVVQNGLNTLADVAGASEGEAPLVGADGLVAFGPTGGGGTPAGNTGEVQFNDDGEFGSSPAFAYLESGGNVSLDLCTTEDGVVEIKGNALGVQLQLTAADGDADHVGGEISISGGSSAGQDGGSINIAAGSDNSDDGSGGDIVISSGASAVNDGGNVTIRANPVATVGWNGGDIQIVAGTGDHTGGTLLLQAGNSSGGTKGTVQTYSGDGGQSTELGATGLRVSANIGFYGTAPIAQQTGVAVNAAAIHAALVALGLITA